MDGQLIMSSNDQHTLKHRWKMKFRPIDYMVYNYNFLFYCFVARKSMIYTTLLIKRKKKKRGEEKA
jgi:hypothetical protein